MSNDSIDQTQLRHLADQATAAVEQRKRQRQLEDAARAEREQRVAVERLRQLFEDLFGVRTAARLGLRFCYDQDLRRAVALAQVDGQQRFMYYLSEPTYSFNIYRPGDDYAGQAYYGDAHRLRLPDDADERAEQQGERAERLILALARTFEPVATITAEE